MEKIIDMVLKAITVAMGVAVVVLSVIGHMSARTGFTLLGLGLACSGVLHLKK